MDHRISAMTLKMRKRHAKDCTMNIQQLLHSNKSDKGPTSSSKATKNIRIDLIHLDGNIMFPRQCIRLRLRHQPSDSWWSTWNWDSSSWSEQCLFSRSR